MSLFVEGGGGGRAHQTSLIGWTCVSIMWPQFRSVSPVQSCCWLVIEPIPKPKIYIHRLTNHRSHQCLQQAAPNYIADIGGVRPPSWLTAVSSLHNTAYHVVSVSHKPWQKVLKVCIPPWQEPIVLFLWVLFSDLLTLWLIHPLNWPWIQITFTTENRTYLMDSTCSSHKWDIFDRTCLTIIFICTCVTYHALTNRSLHRRVPTAYVCKHSKR